MHNNILWAAHTAPYRIPGIGRFYLEDREPIIMLTCDVYADAEQTRRVGVIRIGGLGEPGAEMAAYTEVGMEGDEAVALVNVGPENIDSSNAIVSKIQSLVDELRKATVHEMKIIDFAPANRHTDACYVVEIHGREPRYEVFHGDDYEVYNQTDGNPTTLLYPDGIDAEDDFKQLAKRFDVAYKGASDLYVLLDVLDNIKKMAIKLTA